MCDEGLWRAKNTRFLSHPESSLLLGLLCCGPSLLPCSTGREEGATTRVCCRLLPRIDTSPESFLMTSRYRKLSFVESVDLAYSRMPAVYLALHRGSAVFLPLMRSNMEGIQALTPHYTLLVSPNRFVFSKYICLRDRREPNVNLCKCWFTHLCSVATEYVL